MTNFKITRASDLDRESVFKFLDQNFAGLKSQFIRNHGEWKYRGSKDALAVMDGHRIAAYCAVMPVTVFVSGEAIPTRWWVDLIVDPEYRGQGLQTMIDHEIRDSAHLTLGFPNEFAAVLHKKHGWGVREDGRVVMLPLRPELVASSRKTVGAKSLLSSAVGNLAAPAAAALRSRLKNYKSVYSSRLEEVDAKEATALHETRQDHEIISTLRDAGHFKWRYQEFPNAGELSFFRARSKGAATHLLITRTLQKQGMTVTRILDIIGDENNIAVVKDLVKAAIKEAVSKGAAQVTVMAWPRDQVRLFRSLGFVVGTKARFCWYSPSEDLMNAVANSQPHWTIGDADNDEPG